MKINKYNVYNYQQYIYRIIMYRGFSFRAFELIHKNQQNQQVFSREVYVSDLTKANSYHPNISERRTRQCVFKSLLASLRTFDLGVSVITKPAECVQYMNHSNNRLRCCLDSFGNGSATNSPHIFVEKKLY